MMEASAKQHSASESRYSYEDSQSFSRRMSNTRQEDVLSLNSWSDFEKLDISDSSIRDLSLTSDCRYSAESRLQKNYSVEGSKSQQQDTRSSKSKSSVESIANQDMPVSNTVHNIGVNNARSRSISSAVSSVRSRSRSNDDVERGPYGRPRGAQKCVYDYTLSNVSDPTIIDRPDYCNLTPNPFQDFSFLDFPADGSSRNCAVSNGERDTSSIKSTPKLYPLLDGLEQCRNGSDSLTVQGNSTTSHAFHEQLNDGPSSMPVLCDYSHVGENSSFRSLPISVSQSNHSQSPPHRNETEDSHSQSRSHGNRDFQQKGPWSLWKLYQSQPLISKTPALKRQPKSSSDLEALRESFEHRLEHDNVKTKVISAWNNFKYGWVFNTKSTIKYDSPLFMLGKCYHMRRSDNNDEPAKEFQKDFTSRIWMTYRSNFYPIPGTKLNTDCGWGCMLRSAQMLISQCLVTHYLGRDWRLHNPQTETQYAFYREIIRWFSDPVDAPSDKMPFSLHHLVSFGRHYKKEPGEWFGPSSAAYIFRDAFARASQTLPILSQLCIYVAQDCTVYMDDVVKLCTAKEKSGSFTNSNDGGNCQQQDDVGDTWLRSLIILIPMRLGGEVMNEIYVPCVQNLLAQENCMGIIGGKPKHSLYFVGWQENKLIHLDPHYCREAVDTSDKNFKIETYHCMTPKKLTITKMDPSCTVGFYIRNAFEFKKFVEEVREFVFPEKQRGAYPLFIFAEGSHDEKSQHEVHTGQDRGRVKVTHYQIDKNGQKQRTYSRDSEDFIIL